MAKAKVVALKAKVAKVVQAKGSALTDAGVKRIASTWIGNEREAATLGGTLVSRLVGVMAEVLPEGSGVVDSDVTRIVAVVAKDRKWSKDSLKVRVSQCRAFMQTRHELPDVIEEIATEFDACHWDDAYEAAKALVKEEDPMAAVKKRRKNIAKRKAAAKKPAANKDAARTAAAPKVKAILKIAHLSTAFKNKLREACEAEGIVLGNA